MSVKRTRLGRSKDGRIWTRTEIDFTDQATDAAVAMDAAVLISEFSKAAHATQEMERKAQRHASSSRGGSSRAAPAWHSECEIHAKTLLQRGDKSYQLVSKCAKKFDRSDDAVRKVLKAADLLKERKNRVE